MPSVVYCIVMAQPKLLPLLLPYNFFRCSYVFFIKEGVRERQTHDTALPQAKGADNPKYTISMVVVRPHKLPVTIGMLSIEVNLLIEWLMNRKK